MGKIVAISVLAVLFGITGAAGGQIMYVDADASGANNGSSWADAYNYLQDALADGDEIWVAQGIYKPDQGVGVTPRHRGNTFQLKNGVDIKGAYAGFGEPDPNARDIDAYETILSGDLAGNDIDVNDPADLWDEPTRGDNCDNVVRGRETDGTAVLDGFTITGGNCSYVSLLPFGGGGGMYNDYASSPTVSNCMFTSNSAIMYGGGMCNEGDSNPTLTNCVFSGNYAGYGGGMRNYQSSPTLANCTFRGNAAYLDGGMLNHQSSPTLTNCTFSKNSGDYGGALSNHDGSNSIVTNCILWGGTPQEIRVDALSMLVITYSDVQGGWPGIGNIDADPCFADPNNGDYHLKSQAGRYDANEGRWTRDGVTSPCIDAGDPASPVGHESFPNGGVINMGAYGGTAEGSKSYFGEPVCETIVAGDINGDCKVNFKDFALMALHWLEVKRPCWQVPEFYYYYYDEKIYLDISTDLITLCFHETVSEAEKQAVIREDPTLENIYDEILSYGLVLVQTKVGTCEGDIIQAVERLSKLPEVKYSTPVFESGNVKLVFMNRFVVRFKPDVTAEDIATLNEEYGVAVVSKSPYRPNRYVLRVINPKEKSALELANIYNQLPQTEYGSPDFIVLGGYTN